MNRERLLRGAQKLTNSGPYHYQKAWNFDLDTWIDFLAWKDSDGGVAAKIAADICESCEYSVMYDPDDDRFTATPQDAEKFKTLLKMTAEGACGTSACAGGSFATDDWFRSEGLLLRLDGGEMIPYFVDDDGSERTDFYAMAAFFDIPYDLANTLFSPTKYDRAERRGEKGRLAVAQRIVDILETGCTKDLCGDVYYANRPGGA